MHVGGGRGGGGGGGGDGSSALRCSHVCERGARGGCVHCLRCIEAVRTGTGGSALHYDAFCHCVRVVKEMDLKSIGLCPHGLNPIGDAFWWCVGLFFVVCFGSVWVCFVVCFVVCGLSLSFLSPLSLFSLFSLFSLLSLSSLFSLSSLSSLSPLSPLSSLSSLPSLLSFLSSLSVLFLVRCAGSAAALRFSAPLPHTTPSTSVSLWLQEFVCGFECG